MSIFKKLFAINKPEPKKTISFENTDSKIMISPRKIHLKDGHTCRIRYDSKEKSVELECQFFAEQFEEINQYHALRYFIFENPIKPNIEAFANLLEGRLKNIDLHITPKKKVKELLTQFQQIAKGYDEKAA